MSHSLKESRVARSSGNFPQVLLALPLFTAWLTGGHSLNAGSAALPSAETARAAMRLLKTECLACHNQEKKKGGLVLASREALLKGGDDGAVVVPGKPEASQLAKALLKDADPHMPPKKQLADAQIKVIHEWIRRGVPWDAKAMTEEDPVTPVELAALPASYQPVMALALSTDGKKLAFGRGGSVVVHDLSQTNFPALAQLEAHRDAVQALAWSREGHWLASGAFRRLALWNGESFELAREWTNGLAGHITAIQFSPDGGQLVLADGLPGQSGFVRVFRLADGTRVGSWRAHEDTIFGLDLSHDGRQLVTAGGDKLIKVWDLASGSERARLEGHTAQVLAVAFNSNATQVVSGGTDKQLKVWDIATREKLISLGNHSASVTAVVWPGDGQAIVAATDGGSVFTYENLKAHTGEQSSSSGDEKKVGDAGEAVLCAAAGTEPSRIVTGSHDGVVHVWSRAGNLLVKLSPPLPTQPACRSQRPSCGRVPARPPA